MSSIDILGLDGRGLDDNKQTPVRHASCSNCTLARFPDCPGVCRCMLVGNETTWIR